LRYIETSKLNHQSEAYLQRSLLDIVTSNESSGFRGNRFREATWGSVHTCVSNDHDISWMAHTMIMQADVHSKWWFPFLDL
jgi:hypothetical protein